MLGSGTCQVGSTMMNEQSSRSHCVVMLRVATKLSQKGETTLQETLYLAAVIRRSHPDQGG